MEKKYTKKTVGEFIEALKGFSPSTEIWFSKDEEGNTFHAIANLELTLLTNDKDEENTVLVVYPLNTKDDIF